MSPIVPDMATRVPALDRAFALGMSVLVILATLMTFAAAPARVSAAEGNCGVVPIDLVFVIDRSGSMNTTEGALTRLGWAKLAATGLVDQFNVPAGSVGTLNQIGVSSFGGTTTTRNIQLGTSNAASVKAAIDLISASGGTPFDIGMAEGADNMLDGDRTTYNSVPVTQVLIFLSDGNPDPDSYAPNSTEIGNYLLSADKAYAVAIGPDGGDLGGGGTGVSYDLMRQISKPAYVNDGNPGGFRAVTNASGLPNLFDELYEEIACPVGNLEVRKALSPTNDPGKFDLSIDGQLLANEAGHNGSTGEQSVDAGNHTFSEAADGETSLASYAASASCVNTANQNASVAVTPGQSGSWSVNVADGSDVVCTITNTRLPGTLIVTKDLTADDGSDATCGDFSFAVNGGNPIAFEEDCSNSMAVAPGTYSVVETDADGFETGYEHCSELQISSGGSATCTISNDDQPGTLIVNKVISGGDADFDDFSFSVNDGSEVAFEADGSNELTVPAGTYSVVETDANGYSATYQGCSEVTIPNGGTATCTITNTFVEVETPTLVIDKAADAEMIVISGPDDALVATPSVVTWTLTYTLTNGSVTNVVITDVIPEGFVFLDAANGGNFADGTVTWTFASLSESGSVSFRTTVDPETISRADPTVNSATIDSDETPEDEGTDSVTVAVEPPPQGGNPTPSPLPSMPDTSLGIGPGGEPVTVPVELLAAVFIGSLGALTLANVKARGRRR